LLAQAQLERLNLATAVRRLTQYRVLFFLSDNPSGGSA
jgi:hypothetical protein